MSDEEDSLDNFKYESKEKKADNSNIIAFSELYDNLYQLKKYICKIETPNLKGTGTLLKLQKGKEPFYCLLTCEHIITDELINNESEIEIRYNYISNGNTKYSILKLKLKENERFIRTYKYLGIDAAIVQIFPNKNEINEEFFFENNINNELDELVKDNYKELNKKTIHILQFPDGGDTLSYSTGDFLEIYNINEFLHKASTHSGSSGSPILYFHNDKSLIIFGIHKGGSISEKFKGKVKTELKKGENLNYGNLIYPIIDSLRKDNSMFVKNIIFKGEIIENEQKGELLLLNENTERYDKIYIGELSHYIPHGKGIMYKINICPTKEDISKISNNKYLLNEMKNNNKRKYYCGDFSEGKFHGNGILYYNQDGRYYIGEFRKNLRHGKGKYYENNRLMYEGEFKEDEYDGKGKLNYVTGGSFEGEFTKGKRIGEGNEIDIYGKRVGKDRYQNSQPLSSRNLNNLNNTINALFSFGNEILRKFNVSINFTCQNCGCSTEDHYLIGNSIWECRVCYSRCKNNILNNFK